MNDENRKIDSDESVREKNTVIVASRTRINSVINYLQPYRYWLLLAVWVVGCVLHFIFIDKPVAGAEGPFTIRRRLEATVYAGLLTLLLYILLFHVLGGLARDIYERQIKPIAFHLWQYRWIYLFVPTLVVSCVGLGNVDYSQSESTGYSSALSVLDAASMGLLAALLIMWFISLLYSFAIEKLQWLVALFVLPPLSLVFFFHGEQVDNQSALSRLVERCLDCIASQFWVYRWLWVILAALVTGGFWCQRAFEEVQSPVVCFVFAMIAAVVIAMPIAFFKALSEKKYYWTISVLICPPLALIFFGIA